MGKESGTLWGKMKSGRKKRMEISSGRKPKNTVETRGKTARKVSAKAADTWAPGKRTKHLVGKKKRETRRKGGTERVGQVSKS